MRNSTVKSYANKTRNIGYVEEDDFSLGIKEEEKQVSTFDHMPAILKSKGREEGEVFLIDGDVEALKGLISLVKDTDSEEIKIGVLFRVDGHTTPFCIEKKIDESGEETISVYHTDSVVMDIDQGEQTRQLIREVAKVAPVYSLGFQDSDRSILRDFKRQSDIGSCATYSLFDIEEMIKDRDFSDFVAANHKITREDNIFDLCALPPVFMSTIQSIDGKQDADADENIRNGLRYFIEKNNIPEQQLMEINGEMTSLLTLMREIEEEQIKNPVIDIMNETNLKHYEDAQNRYSEKSFEIYEIDSDKLQEKKEHLAGRIFDIASERYEEDGSDISDSTESLSDYVIDQEPSSPPTPTRSPEIRRLDPSILFATGLVLGIIIITALRRSRLELQKTRDIEGTEFDDGDYVVDEAFKDVTKSTTNDGLEQNESGDISEDEFMQSSFAKGSNTAKLLEKRGNKHSSGERY
jgi:hypothetical protein